MENLTAMLTVRLVRTKMARKRIEMREASMTAVVKLPVEHGRVGGGCSRARERTQEVHVVAGSLGEAAPSPGDHRSIASNEHLREETIFNAGRTTTKGRETEK